MKGIHRILQHAELTERNRKRLLQSSLFLVYVFLYAPVLVVALLSFTDQRVPTFPMEGFTLRWYAQLVPPDYNLQMINGLLQSLRIAIISSIGAGIIGTLTALGLVRGNFESKWVSSGLLNTLFLSPIVVPWVVTGIALLTLYNRLGISGTFISLVLGHIVITTPFVIMVVSARLYDFNRELEEAAKNLGATRLRTFYEITLPLIAPGIIAGMLFAFTISFDNFTQTFFWIGTNTETLPIVIYSQIRTGLNPTINAIGTVIVVFSVSLALLAEKISSRYM